MFTRPTKVFADGGFTGPAAYTLLGAYLNREEAVKGSLEPGKYADMIVLSDDLLTIDPEQIMAVTVEQTYLNGELVFQQ